MGKLKLQKKLELLEKQKEYLSLLEAKKERGKKDLFFFNKYILESNENRKKLLVPHVHGEWTDWFNESDKRIRCILVPRSSFKSTFFTAGWSLQLLVSNPAIRILIANATLNNAQKFLGEIKQHLQKNEELIRLYGKLYRKGLKWSEDEMDIVGKPLGVREPNISAAGVGGNLVSQHYDVIIGDDLVNLENSATRFQANKVIDWWQRSLSLLEPNGTYLLIGTRWAYYELYSYLQEELNDKVDFYIRGAFKEDGSLYFPERFNYQKLAELKALHGSYIFSAFYLNKPVDEDSAIIKESQLKYFTEEQDRDIHTARLPDRLNIFAGVDPAFSQESGADYTGISVVGVDEFSNWFILKCSHEKLTSNELINELFEINSEFSPETICIELIGGSQSILGAIQEEEKKRGVNLPLYEIKAQGMVSKETRIRTSLQPKFEQGKVYLRKGMGELVDELLRFPKAPHDDMIDSMSLIDQVAYAPNSSEAKQQMPSSKLEARIRKEDQEVFDEIMGNHW